MMEAMILLLGQQMSVSAVARHLAESDKRLWRVLEHYVMEAHAAKDWSQVRRLMIDETSARKGHRYVTVVLDAESHDLLLMVEGRSAQVVTEFIAAMPAHRAKAEAITEVVMDMSPAYIAGVQTHFPKARIVFDLFHIMKLAGEALDAVRKSLRQQGADLTGGLWALRGNEWTRSQEQLDLAASWPAPIRSWAAPSPSARLSSPRSIGRWRPAFHPLVAGLGRPFSARTFPPTLSNSQRTFPRHPGLPGNPPDECRDRSH
jgi:transposase